MNKKDLLKLKAKGKLATDTVIPKSELILVSNISDIDQYTREIKSDISELAEIVEWWKVKKERVAELKISIIEKLIFIRDHKKKLLGNRNFEDYLSMDIGLSKGYFYEQLQAYNVCAEYKRPDLFKEVDHKILVNIAREKDPEKQQKLINKAPSLSRDYFKKVSPTDFSETESLVAKVSREKLSIKVSDKQILKQIESLLKANGIKIEYV